MKIKLVPTLIPTRKARRAAAKHTLSEVRHLFKKTYEKNGKRASYFALYWKETQ